MIKKGVVKLALLILLFNQATPAKTQNEFIETKESATGYIQFHSEFQELWVWDPHPENTGISHQILAVFFKIDSATVFTGLPKSIILSPGKSKSVMRVSVIRDKGKLICHSIDVRTLATAKKKPTKNKKGSR